MPHPHGFSLRLSYREVNHIDGIALGVEGGVFEGHLAVGDGVVVGRLHESVDEDDD